MNTVWDAKDAVDLRHLVERLLARRWFVVLCVTVSTALFSAYAFLAAPVYRASTVLIPTTSEREGLAGALSGVLSQVGGLSALTDIGDGARATDEALAVLRSREFSERFIEELALKPKFFPDEWDEETRTWRGGSDSEPSLAKAFRYFDREIRTLVEDRRTGLVTVQIDWRDPEDAALWANELVRRLNAEMRGRAIENAEASVAFLQEELAGTSLVTSREAIGRLLETQIRQRMLANVTHEYSFRVVDRALTPDTDDPLRPRKALLLVAGLVVGLFVALLGVLVPDAVARSR